MRRRSPPTALLLVPGPTPARSTAKHTLPSLPRPTFHPPTLNSTHRTRPRARHSDIKIEGDMTPVTAKQAPKVLRGPWDHSGSIKVPFDVETVLAPLKPAAMSYGYGR